jgi:Ca-activated chloride channel family protein
MRLTTLWAAALFLLPISAPAQPLPDTARTIIVLDGSGSMWGQIGGRPKLEIAREVLGQVLADIPADRELGLMAYGHRRRGDCGDIELVVPPAPGTAGQITAAANAMRFQGRTPLTDAVRQAARALNFTENPATVILITDGIETCNADPCALGRELAAAGVGFTAHVVGFGMTAEEGAQVACLAQETGGQYLLAQDAAGLSAALSATIAAQAGTPPPAPPPPPAPAPVAEAPPLPPATLNAPAEVAALERFQVAVTGPMNPGDYLDVVYDGQTRIGDLLFWVMLDRGNPATLTAPVEPGDYVIRYIEARDGVAPRVLATAPLSVAPASYGLQAAGTVMGGAQLRVEWQADYNDGDWIDFAPAGSTDPNTTVTWAGVNPEGAPVDVTVPLAPGDYDLRFVALGPEGPRVMSTRPVTVTPAAATLTAPDRVEAGATYRVGWSGPFHPSHYITLTDPGAGDDDYAHGYFYLPGPGLPGALTAPAAPGSYELRFVLYTEGPQVLARRTLQVVAPGTLPAEPAAPQGLAVQPTRAGTVEPGTDRPGLDLGQTTLDTADPLACQALCAGDADCRAWTFVHPPEGGQAGICWTKFDVPEAIANPCCTSGVMEGPGAAPGSDAKPEGAPAPLPDRGALPAPEGTTGRAEAPAPGGAAVAYACPASSTAPCAFADPATGLTYTLAPGYGITEPFFHETPGGARASRPTFDLIRLADGEPVAWVNLRQAAVGCVPAGEDQLCFPQAPRAEDQPALMFLMLSLAEPAPAAAPEVEGMGEDSFAGVWTLRIWQDGHPRNEFALAVVELDEPDADGITRGRFRSAPDYEGFAAQQGEAVLWFEADGRMRLDLVATDGAALVFTATPFGPLDWTGELAPPGPAGPAPVGAALSFLAAPGEDWDGAPWMRGEPDGMAAALRMGQQALEGLSQGLGAEDRAVLQMLGGLMGAVAPSATGPAAPSPQMQALGGVAVEGLTADEALILLVPHLEVTR